MTKLDRGTRTRRSTGARPRIINPFKGIPLGLRTYSRFLRQDGEIDVERVGLPQAPIQDLYHRLLTLSWVHFFALAIAAYVLTNLVFALAYLIGGDNIANAQPGSLLDAFFFSVQTMATIGYGALYPKTLYANFLVSIEALAGLLGVAMVTGLMFARFSRPNARVMFSRVAVISPYNGTPTLFFRTANQRQNQIIEARLWVTLARDEVTAEGDRMRRLYDLKLVRDHTPLFALTWTAMHTIDETSPFYRATPESLAASEVELIITLTGTDEVVAQPIHARHSFVMREILWNMRFVNLLTKSPDGKRRVDYTRFHDVVPLEPILEQLR